MSDLLTLQTIFTKIKGILSLEKLSPLWRFILMFFSTDYFVSFNWSWIEDWQHIREMDERTTSIFTFIAIYVIIYFLIYVILKWPLRLIFHGKVKIKIQSARKEIEKKDKGEITKDLIDSFSRISRFFQKYLFKYGLIGSNDLNDPIVFEISEKEEGFNEAMNSMYKWILMIIHTVVLFIIVWKVYAWWFYAIMAVVFILSIFVTWALAFMILNIEVLELLRLKLLKENKKHWK